MRLAPPAHLPTYRVFISSADTPRLRQLRDRVELLIRDVVSDQLRWSNEGFRFETMRWETSPAQRTDGPTIQQFVQQALLSQLTIVLLADEVRPGTRREVRAVTNYAAQRIEVAILRFSRKTKANAESDEVGRYLAGIRRRHNLLVRTLNRGDAQEEWIEMTRTAVAALIAGYQTHYTAERPRFDEVR